MISNATAYSPTVKTLHWLIGLAILGQIGLGWVMTDNEILVGPTRSAAYGLHKSIGMTLLVLCLVRWGLFLARTPLPLPAAMARWERAAAGVMHHALLILPALIALIGWMILSTQPKPTLYFGLFTVPNLPFLPDLADKKDWRNLFEAIHGALAWAILGGVALHGAAALKHHVINRDDILIRMMPTALVPIIRGKNTR